MIGLLLYAIVGMWIAADIVQFIPPEIPQPVAVITSVLFVIFWPFFIIMGIITAIKML